MKPAEDWFSGVLDLKLFSGDERTPEQFIRQIQTDALKAAAEAISTPNKAGRSWVLCSFWDTLAKEQSAVIHSLIPKGE